MRFWAPLLAFAAVAFAQNGNNQINTPRDGFSAQAGQPITITWENPGEGNVDIRLTQGNNIQPGAGTLLITVPASQGTATFTLPPGTDLNGNTYNFEIVSSTDPSNPNFSSGFMIAGASGTGSTSGSSSMSMTMTATDSSSTDTATTTDSSSSTATDSSASASNSASASSDSSSSTTSGGSVSTSAPSNGAGSMQMGGLLAMVAGAIAVF